MPRQPKPSARATIYQLESPLEANTALRRTYVDRDGFTEHQVMVATRAGVLVGGTIARETASWAPLVESWINDARPVTRLGNATAACVLLLPTSEAGRIWAITFGMGFQMLEPSRVVPSLGRRIAVRCADPAHLRSVTHTRLDSRAFVARTSIPGGDDLGGFGASELGDLVSRLVGPAGLDGLLANEAGASADIRGADAVNLPLARDPRRLIADLDAIEVILRRQPRTELAMIEQLQVLKNADPRIAELEVALDTALGSPSDPALGLAWPTELADEAVPLSHLVITGLPLGMERDDQSAADLEAVLRPLEQLEAGDRVRRLDRMRVQAFSDEDDPASNLLPARRWLTFETVLNDQRFCMHDGRWYAVDRGLAERLATRASAVFNAPSSLPEIPHWPGDDDEASYNRQLAAALGGVCLDRHLVVCESHPRIGFEAADVLTPTGVLVHVKAVDRSAPASHLFAQAGVSTQALLQDTTAVQRLKEIIGELGGDPGWLPERVETVALVLGNPRLLTAESLPSFARMRLVRLADECRAQAVRLSATPVVRA